MSSKEARLSVIQREDFAIRQAMRKRRQEVTNRIRKDKKSHLLALKRRYNIQTRVENTAQTISSREYVIDMIKIANNIIQKPSELLSNLDAFQSALSACPNQFKPEDIQDPFKFINILSSAIKSVSSHHRIVILQVLTNISAIESPSNEGGYYGHLPPTWTSIILKTDTLISLREILSMKVETGEIEHITQCCWILGNLVADSEAAGNAIRPFLRILCEIIRRGLEQKLPIMCRNAAWTLSNLARVKSFTQEELFGDNHLSLVLIVQLLTSPEKLIIDISSPVYMNVTWLDVVQETMWILVYSSAKTDLNFNFLFHSSDLLLEAIAFRLDLTVRVIFQLDPSQHSEISRFSRILIPCIRAVGNLASGFGGKQVNSLLKANSSSISLSLATLLEMGSSPSKISSDIHAVASETAWVAGTLLCDAGIPEHLSTKVALPTLLPELCTCVTSDHAKLELKREALLSIWNASAAPPDHSNMNLAESTRLRRDRFLQEIIDTPLMMNSLIRLVQSMDIDVVQYSLWLLDVILRRLKVEVRHEFEELGGVEALEYVCDNYSSVCDWQGNSNSPADIAADLIDDLFDTEIEGDEEMNNIAPSSTETSFQFGLQPSAEAIPVGNQNSLIISPSPIGRGRGTQNPSWMSHGQHSTITSSTSTGRGRGRGRGMQTPAWML